MAEEETQRATSPIAGPTVNIIIEMTADVRVNIIKKVLPAPAGETPPPPA